VTFEFRQRLHGLSVSFGMVFHQAEWPRTDINLFGLKSQSPTPRATGIDWVAATIICHGRDDTAILAMLAGRRQEPGIAASQTLGAVKNEMLARGKIKLCECMA
jgi:hypothetical protein